MASQQRLSAPAVSRATRKRGGGGVGWLVNRGKRGTRYSIQPVLRTAVCCAVPLFSKRTAGKMKHMAQKREVDTDIALHLTQEQITSSKTNSE